MNLLYATCYPDATTTEIESALVNTKQLFKYGEPFINAQTVVCKGTKLSLFSFERFQDYLYGTGTADIKDLLAKFPDASEQIVQRFENISIQISNATFSFRCQ